MALIRAYMPYTHFTGAVKAGYFDAGKNKARFSPMKTNGYVLVHVEDTGLEEAREEFGVITQEEYSALIAQQEEANVEM